MYIKHKIRSFSPPKFSDLHTVRRFTQSSTLSKLLKLWNKKVSTLLFLIGAKANIPVHTPSNTKKMFHVFLISDIIHPMYLSICSKLQFSLFYNQCFYFHLMISFLRSIILQLLFIQKFQLFSRMFLQ